MHFQSSILSTLVLANSIAISSGFCSPRSYTSTSSSSVTTELYSSLSNKNDNNSVDAEEAKSLLSRRTVFDNAYKSSIAFTTAGIYNTNNPIIANALEEDTAIITTTAAVQQQTSSSSSPIPTIKLGKSSLEVSRTIQGYWQLAGGHGKYNTDEAIKNMEAHYKAGITTLDTADIYGPSEQIMGRFLEKNSGGGAVPCTKFCCFRYLDEIDKEEVRTRIKKVCYYLLFHVLFLRSNI